MPGLTWALTVSAFLLVRMVTGLRGQGEQGWSGGTGQRVTGIKHRPMDISKCNPGSWVTPPLLVSDFYSDLFILFS